MREPTLSDFTIGHFLCIGRIRSGKSKWFEHFVRLLTQNNQWGFAAIDRKGQTARDLIDYMAYRLPDRKTIVLDCTRKDYLTPINLNMGASPGLIRDGIIKVFGDEDANITTRIAKWMLPISHLFSSGEYTFNEVMQLLEADRRDLRQDAAKYLHDSTAQSIWRELMGLNRHEYTTEIASTQNRLQRFSNNIQLKRMMGTPRCSVDFGAIIEEGVNLIVNIQETEDFERESGLLVGTLIINGLLHAVMRRGSTPLKQPYFLLIDEASEFISPDVRDALTMGAGPGLHMGLFLQDLGQAEEHGKRIYKSILGGCLVKVIFRVVPQDARALVDELFVPNQAERTDLIRRLAFQEQAHYVIHVPGKGTFKKQTPKIQSYYMEEDYKQQLILDRFIKPYALPVSEIDEELDRRLNSLVRIAPAGIEEVKTPYVPSAKTPRPTPRRSK